MMFTTSLAFFLVAVFVRVGASGTGDDPTAVAEAVNALFKQSNDGILLRSVGIGFTQPWRFCENKTYPGAYCAKVYSAGRSSFQLLNKNAWNETTKTIQMFFGTPQSGASNCGYIASEKAKQTTVTCSYANDGWTGARKNGGCGCDFWYPCKEYSRASCALGLAGPQWCTANSGPSGGQCGCAYAPEDLSRMLDEAAPQMSRSYTEVIVSAKQWNDDVPQSIRAFYIRANACAQGSKCYTDFVKWYNEFRQMYGDKPILLIDEHRNVNPFYPHPVQSPPLEVLV